MNVLTFVQQRRALLLMLMLFTTIVIYATLTWIYRLPLILPRQRANVGSLSDYRWSTALWLGLAGIALHSCYFIGGFLCWQLTPTRRVIAMIWGGAGLIAVLLFAIFPVTSSDIFDYLFRGRIAAAYDQNPYIQLPNQFKNDPFFPTVGWPNAPSAYGPLWEMLSEALARIGGNSLLANVLLHKAVACLTYLLCGGLIWRIARSHGRSVQLLGTFLWLWNPLTIWEILAAGHNDGLMVAAVLLGVWAVERDQILEAVIALTVGALFKFLPIILLPLVVIYGMRSLPTWRLRLRLGLMSVLIWAGLTVLAYVSYWAGPETFNNIGVRELFVTSSPLAVLSYALREPGPLAQINSWLAWSGLPGPAIAADVRAAVNYVAGAMLALGLIWQMAQIWWRGRGIWQATFGLLLWYLTLGNQWFQPWYVLWLLGLLAIRPARRTWLWLAVWGMAGQASYLLHYVVGPRLRQEYGELWSGQRVVIQSLSCLVIFGPLVVAWAVDWWYQRGATARVAVETTTTHPSIIESTPPS